MLRKIFPGVENSVVAEGCSCRPVGSLWHRIYAEVGRNFRLMLRESCVVSRGFVVLVLGHRSLGVGLIASFPPRVS